MLANHKGEIPFFILLIPYLLGIGFGIWFPQTNYIFTVIGFAVFALAFITLNINYQRLKFYRLKWIGGAIFYSLLLFAGWFSVNRYNELSSPDHFSKTKSQYLAVIISNEPKFNNGVLRFTADVKRNILNGKSNVVEGNLMISIKDSNAVSLNYGDELLIPSNYKSIDGPANPAEFNYKRYLFWQNIHFQSFLFKGQYHIIGHDAGNSLIASSLQMRRHLVEIFKQQMHNPEAIAVASTLILGYKADLSDDVMQAYSKTGTIHVLSVSGAHVAIVLLLLEFLLGFMNRFRHGKIIRAAIIVLCVWYYSMLSGFSPAVCRAAVMISFFIVGKTFNRHINSLNILALSAFALLMYDPYFIADVGFQLSYLAVFGLVVLQPIVYKWFDISNKWACKLWQLCSISIAAQVITFPLSIFYFHQFPVYFLVSNLLIIIPTTVIMYSGIGCLAFSFIPPVSKILGVILEWSILFMDRSLKLIENTPYSGISRIWITDLQYLLLFILVISLFYFMHKQQWWVLRLGLLSLLLVCGLSSFTSIRSMRSDEVIFLKLRKHTGLIFRHGDKATVITDLPDTDRTFRYSIKPYLDSCSVGKLNIIKPDSNSTTSYLLKHCSLINFLGKQTLMLDKQTIVLLSNNSFRIDNLYVTGSPHFDPDSIGKHLKFNRLIIGDNNSDKTIKRWSHYADSCHISCQNLKLINHAGLFSN